MDDNAYQKLLKEFRDHAYKTGYYSARMESVSVVYGTTKYNEYESLHKTALAKRNAAHGDLLRMGALGNTRSSK